MLIQSGQLPYLIFRPVPDNQIRACPDSSLYMLFIMLQRNHDINAHKSSVCLLLCQFYMLFNCPDITVADICFKIRFVIPDLSSGNNPDTTFFRNGSCQLRTADTNAHTALNDWYTSCFLSYFQFLKFHSTLHFRICDLIILNSSNVNYYSNILYLCQYFDE